VLRGFVEAESAELFLNGTRISFLPLSSQDAFQDILRPFYRLTPQTSLDLAILEDEAGSARAVSLRSLLLSNDAFAVRAGDKVHLFENQFLAVSAEIFTSKQAQDVQSFSALTMSNSRQAQNGSEANLTAQSLAQNEKVSWKELAQLLTRAGVVRVIIDNELRAFLPGAEPTSLADALDTLGLENLNLFSDLVTVQRTSSQNRNFTELRSLAGDITASLPHHTQSITFYTQSGKENLLTKADGAVFEELTSKALNLYIDYEQVQLGIPSDLSNRNSEMGQKLSSPDIFPLFTIYEYFDQAEGFWQKDALSLADLRTEGFGNQVAPGSRITLFSRDYLGDLINPSSGSGSNAEQRLIGLQASGLDISSEERQEVDQQRILQQILAREEQLDEKETSSTKFSPNLQFLLSASRYVSGAVERPGYYPVAGTVTLSQLLSAAGGLTENADIARIEVTQQKVNGGKILADKIKLINLTKSEANTVRLLDRYSVNVPTLLNEIATGLVTLNGEVQRPGDYLIARDETLHDLITRAGGLTGVAYPLGAVFTRESLKESQRESNALLANQLEQAVLQVAQSDVEGTGEQVKAVLGYAQQLRLQEVTGRLSVNVALADVSAPVYLQAGDTLTIPKRPAHVSVIGSVQKDTVASYSAGKRLNAYLAAAGGANRIADPKRTYILLPNGESTRADKESIIPPGAVIVVPPKTDRLSVLGLTDLVSRVLGNIATSVLAINNVR
jgi:protein involved in polysaccharide export with SLBB domain